MRITNCFSKSPSGVFCSTMLILGLLGVVGCDGINFDLSADKGTKTGELNTVIYEATAPYIILDLATGNRTTVLNVPDLTTNSAYTSSKMVFHRVIGLGGNYLLGVFEVTQAQWDMIAPSATQKWTQVDTAVVGVSAVAANKPAFNVSNDEVLAGLAAFNAGKVVQLALPGDAEWEFACAAGSSGSWSWGTAIDRSTISANSLVAESSTALGPIAVGGLSPNAFGFYDMHGNVWEWTGSGISARLRGGSWRNGLWLARTTNKIDTTQGVYNDTHYALAGFRLVMRQ